MGAVIEGSMLMATQNKLTNISSKIIGVTSRIENEIHHPAHAFRVHRGTGEY